MGWECVARKQITSYNPAKNQEAGFFVAYWARKGDMGGNPEGWKVFNNEAATETHIVAPLCDPVEWDRTHTEKVPPPPKKSEEAVVE